MFNRSMPSPTQESQVGKGCEGKFEVYGKYLVLKKNTLTVPIAGYMRYS